MEEACALDFGLLFPVACVDAEGAPPLRVVGLVPAFLAVLVDCEPATLRFFLSVEVDISKKQKKKKEKKDEKKTK